MINEFENEYYFLNNSYLCPVEWNGTVYRSAEAAFQSAMKTYPNWEQIKTLIMREIIYNKFCHNPKLIKRLIATGSKVLIGGNLKDRYWGVVDGVGKNVLGEILMSVRAQLISQRLGEI